jgi:hypothetical protein
MKTGASRVQERLAITPAPWSFSIPRWGDPALCTGKGDPVPLVVIGCGAIIVETWLLLAARLIRPVYATRRQPYVVPSLRFWNCGAMPTCQD